MKMKEKENGGAQTRDVSACAFMNITQFVIIVVYCLMLSQVTPTIIGYVAALTT